MHSIFRVRSCKQVCGASEVKDCKGIPNLRIGHVRVCEKRNPKGSLDIIVLVKFVLSQNISDMQ